MNSVVDAEPHEAFDHSNLMCLCLYEIEEKKPLEPSNLFSRNQLRYVDKSVHPNESTLSMFESNCKARGLVTIGALKRLLRVFSYTWDDSPKDDEFATLDHLASFFTLF